MQYRYLNDRQVEQLSQEKLLQLEAEHARLHLDLRLARATGVQNDNVVAGEQQLALLIEQIATLTSWITPPPDETVIEGTTVDAAANGQD